MTDLLSKKVKGKIVSQGASTKITNKSDQQDMEITKLVRRQKTLMQMIAQTLKEIASSLDTYYKIQINSLYQHQTDMI